MTVNTEMFAKFFRYNPPPAPTGWNHATCETEKKHATDVAKLREKITRVANPVLWALALGTVATVLLANSMIVPVIVGGLLIAAGIYRFAIPVIFHHPSLEERGLIVNIPEAIYKSDWHYDPSKSKLNIPKLVDVPMEVAGQLIRECAANQIEIVYQN